MRTVYQRCCGLDVHKESVTACLLLIDDDGEYRVEKRRLGTMTRDLRDLATWLTTEGVERIAMEATGVYWKPVWNILEPLGFELLLVNAQHVGMCRDGKLIKRIASGLPICCSMVCSVAVSFHRLRSGNYATDTNAGPNAPGLGGVREPHSEGAGKTPTLSLVRLPAMCSAFRDVTC